MAPTPLDDVPARSSTEVIASILASDASETTRTNFVPAKEAHVAAVRVGRCDTGYHVLARRLGSKSSRRTISGASGYVPPQGKAPSRTIVPLISEDKRIPWGADYRSRTTYRLTARHAGTEVAGLGPRAQKEERPRQ